MKLSGVGSRQSAVDAVQPLNELDLNYPNYGFKAFGDTVNSNSTFRTMSEIMSLPAHDFPGRMEPGLDNRMVPAETIEKLRTHDYPVLEEPSRNRDGKYEPLSSLEPQGRGDAKSASWQPDDPLFGQIANGVQRMNASVGDVPRETSDRMTWRLYALAKETGMDRIDDVALGGKGLHAREGEHVFLIKGDPNTSIYERNQVRTADAIDTPVERSQMLAQTAEQQQARSVAQQAELQEMQQQQSPLMRA